MENTIQAVVLNVERHAHRLSWFFDQAKRIGLSVERLAALDASKEDVRAAIRAVAPNSRLSMGELACMMGHMKAWESLLASNESHLAVFEDDAHLADDLPDLLRLVCVPKGIGLIKLEAYRDKVAIARKPIGFFGGRALHKLLGRSYGSAGYIVSRECAEWLLDEARRFAEPVDHVLFGHEAIVKKRFTVVQVVPAACIQDDCLARLRGGAVQHQSTLERSEKSSSRRNRRSARNRGLKNFSRYLRWVAQGANPIRCRVFVEAVLNSSLIRK